MRQGEAQPQKAQPLKVSAAGPPEQGLTNDMTTSALLKLAALHPQRGANLSGYYKDALGARSTGEAGPGTVPGATVDSTEGTERQEDIQRPGSLSARFESGENGTGTIGYDDSGGTSYGIYQISSRAGTMDRFLDYLDDRAPKMAARLRSCGRANTGSTGGGMPKEWNRIAEEEPERFAQLQHDFIEQSHYTPAMEEILRRTGVDLSRQSRAVQEVLWSTAVQHGPKGAANIFCKAIGEGSSTAGEIPEHKIISSVYTSRVGYLGGLSRDVREAVWRRFQEEKSMALAMLANDVTRPQAQA